MSKWENFSPGVSATRGWRACVRQQGRRYKKGMRRAPRVNQPRGGERDGRRGASRMERELGDARAAASSRKIEQRTRAETSQEMLWRRRTRRRTAHSRDLRGKIRRERMEGRAKSNFSPPPIDRRTRTTVRAIIIHSVGVLELRKKK